MVPWVMEAVMDSTMPKQWNIGTWIIIRSDILTVVDHVVVGQHDPLGKAGGAGGVLHVGHVVGPHGGGAAADLLGRGLPRQGHGLLPGEAPGLPVAHGNHVAQEGQALAVEGLPRLGRGQFRAELGDDPGVVAVPVAVDHHQGVGVGLAEEVLRLVDFIGGVHRHQHRADLRRGPEGDEPGGYVGGPDGHLVAGLHPQGDEGPGKLVHVVPELGVGPGIVQGGVLKGVLVRELLHHPVQHLGEGAVDDDVLLPHVLARSGGVVVEAAFPPLPLEAGHIDGVVGENHFRIVQALHPGGVPEQGNKAVVVDAAQGVHQLPHGHGALARQLRRTGGRAVGKAHMADVGPQVGDGLLRSLPLHQAGAVGVPAGRQVVAGKVVQYLHQLFRIGHGPRTLQQEGDLFFLRFRNEGGQLFDHGLFVLTDGVDRHAGDQEVRRRLHGGRDFVPGLRGHKIGGRSHAGDRQIRRRQLAAGRHGHFRIRGAVPDGQAGVFHAVDLQAVELCVRGGLTGRRPVHFSPVLY